MKSEHRDKTDRSISQLVQSFRNLKIHILAPPGLETNDISQHLRRMGCSATTSWPPLVEDVANVDLVFLLVRPLIEDQVPFDWDTENPPAALIAIADYENPLMVEKTLALQAQSTIATPLRPFGVLIDVLLSYSNFRREETRRKQNAKLKKRIRMSEKVEEAKLIVARHEGVSLDQAYAAIRQCAMNKRLGIDEIVDAVVVRGSLP